MRRTIGVIGGVLMLASGCGPAELSLGNDSAAAERNPNPGFKDIEGHWAESFVRGLSSQGIAFGFPDGTFRPDELATREQLAAFVTRAFPGEERAPARSFVDVPDERWSSAAIAEAVKRGFLVGYPDGTFRPERPLRKVEAVVSFVRGLGLPMSCTSGPCDALLVFSDSYEIADWARIPVAAAVRNGLVSNYPDVHVFDGAHDLTRGELAALLYQALVHLDAAPFLRNPWLVPIAGGDETVAVSSGTTEWIADSEGRRAARLSSNEFEEVNTLEIGTPEPIASIKPFKDRRFYGFAWVTDELILAIEGPIYGTVAQGGDLVVIDADTGAKSFYLAASELKASLLEQGLRDWAGIDERHTVHVDISRFRLERSGADTLNILELHVQDLATGEDFYPRVQADSREDAKGFSFTKESWR